MQRRNFVKLAPAAIVAASAPTTALAETTSEGPAILWSRGEEIFPEFPEASVKVFKDGCQISNWHLGVRDATEHVPNAGDIVGLDSARRIVQVVGLDGAPVDLAYDAVVVSAPLKVLDAMRDAETLPRHWVRIVEEPTFRVVARERLEVRAKPFWNPDDVHIVDHIIVEAPCELSAQWNPFAGTNEYFIWSGNAESGVQQTVRAYGRKNFDVWTEETTIDDILKLRAVRSGGSTRWIEVRPPSGDPLHTFEGLPLHEFDEDPCTGLCPTRPARLVDLTKLR